MKGGFFDELYLKLTFYWWAVNAQSLGFYLFIAVPFSVYRLIFISYFLMIHLHILTCTSLLYSLPTAYLIPMSYPQWSYPGAFIGFQRAPLSEMFLQQPIHCSLPHVWSREKGVEKFGGCIKCHGCTCLEWGVPLLDFLSSLLTQGHRTKLFPVISWCCNGTNWSNSRLLLAFFFIWNTYHEWINLTIWISSSIQARQCILYTNLHA